MSQSAGAESCAAPAARAAASDREPAAKRACLGGDTVTGVRILADLFPQVDEGGTPLVVSIGQVRTRSSGFGQSSSWERAPTCVCP